MPNFPPYTWIENDRILTAPTETYVPNPKPEEGAAEGRPGPMAPGWRQDLVMPTLTEKAVAWLKGAAGKSQPFFLYFPFTSPHAPILPTDAFKGKSRAGPFGDYVVESDWAAGEVLKTLDELGIGDNTIVIFASDNGPEHYAYERMRKFQHRSPGPLRGLKRDIWEGGHRVPMIVRWPGKIPANTVTDGLMSQIDILATLASIVGFEIPAGSAEDSHNQWPLLGGAGDSSRTSLVHNTYKDHYAIRVGHWVLIAAPSGTVTKVPDWVNQQEGYVENDQPYALFDLSEDIGQKENLASSQPDRVQKMLAELARIRAHGEVR